MKLPAFEKTNMLVPTPKERLTRHSAVVLLLFIPIMLLSQLGRDLFYNGATWLFPKSSFPSPVLFQLFATLSTVAVVLLYCLLAERRTLASLGFTRKGAIAEYGIGLAGGFILFGGAVLLCVVCGTLTVHMTETPPPLGMLALFFVAFLIQGMSEELLCRSYLMVSLSRGLPLWACVLTNALLFSLLHAGNPGITVIALINIFLFGLLASVLALRRGSIWMAGALHSMWNFAQGNFFGIPVSGIKGSPSPLISTPGTGTWAELVNGGAFGLEAGLAVTIVLLGACAVVLFVPTKKSEIVKSSL